MVAGNLRSTPALRRLRVMYFGLHGAFLCFGSALITFSALAYIFQAEDLKEVGTEETGPAHIVIIIAGALLIVASIIGIFALLKDKKPYLWILYCMIMAILAFGLFITTVSLLTNHLVHVEEFLNESITRYQDYDRGNTGWNSTSMKLLIDRVDDLQEFNECCGIRGYSDWQDVEFGRTSLKVPKSCCKLKDNETGETITRKMLEDRRRAGTLSNDTAEAYRYCGHLCLPTHPELNVSINIRGCFDVVTGRIHGALEGLGFFGLLVGILVTVIFSFSCFLVVTKRV